MRLDSPVVSGDGLVGIVSNVFPNTAEVTLLTDPNSFVAARDVDTQVRGMVHTGTSGTLILDQVQKQYKVKAGDKLVTAGTHNARYPDLYPYGIPIGTVTYASTPRTRPRSSRCRCSRSRTSARSKRSRCSSRRSLHR